MKGSARQRTKGSWEICIDVGLDPATGKRRRHFESIKGTKKEAQHRLAELLINIEQGTYIKPPKQLTVADWLRHWLEGHAASSLSAKTRESYAREINCYIIPLLGGMRLTALRANHVQGYIAEALSNGRRRGGGLSLRTVQYHYRILAKALDDAIKMGLLAVNACKGVSAPRPARRDIPSYDADEIAKLLSAIQASAYSLLFTLLLLTGLRRGEALALKWRDIDLDLACIYVAHSLFRLDDGTIVVKEPKTARSRRVVDLPPSLALALREYRAGQEVLSMLLGRALTGDNYVFCHTDGNPLNPNTVTHDFSKVARQAGFPHLRLHDLRHLHATMLLKAGTHPRVVLERLGHSSIATTLDIYSHTVPGLQKAAAERLDTLLPKMDSEKNVGKMSAEGTGIVSEPCGSRTHDHLIKSQNIEAAS